MKETLIEIRVNGAEIRRLRKAHNMSLVELGEVAGYNKTAMNNIECGKGNVKQVIAFAHIAWHFGVTMDRLISVVETVEGTEDLETMGGGI